MKQNEHPLRYQHMIGLIDNTHDTAAARSGSVPTKECILRQYPDLANAFGPALHGKRYRTSLTMVARINLLNLLGAMIRSGDNCAYNCTT